MLGILNRKENIVAISIIAFSLFISFTMFAIAQTPNEADNLNIEFPIAELGGCENKDECKAYCDNLDHIGECTDFALRHGLMTPEEASEARRFAGAGGEGPGGCRGKNECHSFCEDISNIEECVAFAEDHGVLDERELDEARKVRKALREGAELPGGCRSREECEAFCENPDNIDQCLAFAERAGFLPPEELEEAKKFADFMKRGETPGGCRGHRECEAFCNNDANFDECSAFALKAGLVSDEEAEIIRKTGGRGPGGCRGRECETFCNNPDNREVCFEFAKEHKLLSEDDLRRFEEGGREFQGFLDGAPRDVVECVRKKVGSENVRALQNGDFESFGGDRENIEREVHTCFEEFGPREDDNHDRRSDGNEEGDFNDFLNSAPREVVECVKSQVSGDNLERGGDDLREVANKCFNQFNPNDFRDERREGDRDHEEGDFQRRPDPRPDQRPDFRPSDHSDTFNEEERRKIESEFRERDRFPEDGSFPNPNDFNQEDHQDDGIDFDEERRRLEEAQRRIEEDQKRRIEDEQRRFDEENRRREEEFRNRDEFSNDNNFSNPDEFNQEDHQGDGSNFKEEDRRQFEQEQQQDADFGPSARRFPRPSDFRSNNFRQPASLLMFIINRDL